MTSCGTSRFGGDLFDTIKATICQKTKAARRKTGKAHLMRRTNGEASVSEVAVESKKRDLSRTLSIGS